ncbi:putative disease resistance protein RGA4 [Abrus precatorius]|uniref:Disease resistance protein RGA4 n=1 Tax=Abrus precatorius TaxID=3816 RepID=A0A8B8LVN1_ABRPR|nr:putative disease resistance protein RGA4 [Abrus precatorius]
MDAAAILADTISDILRCSDSLAPSATHMSEGDLKLLKIHLGEALEAVRKAKHNHSKDSQTWVENVREVVNNLSDLMEDLSLKDTNITATKSLLKAGHNMALRLKATLQLKELEAKLQGFVKVLPNSDQTFKNAFGRENEKKEIVDQLNLLGNKNEESAVAVPVITIVGDAGIGKTRLARLVCEDDQVKARFHIPIWVYGIHEASSLESIPTRVTESAKPFLLVLDDLKAEIKEEFLDTLKKKFTHGGAILITTRSNPVTAATVKAHTVQLQGLNEEDSWSLFHEILGSSSNIKEDTKRGIVKNCGGVPEAIIITAKWSNSRGSPVAKEQVSALPKLHYYLQLPSHQKLCFSYFSLFPRDHLFDSEILIHLWLAEGFLKRNLSSSNNHPRQVGEACLKDLDRFAFQDVEKDECGVVRRFRMKPLMLELAKIVAGEENIMLNSGGDKVDRKVLRASFNFDFDVSCGIPNSLFETAKKLRTILLVAKSDKSRLPHEVKMSASTCDKIFNSFECLRVVDLHDLGIAVVPNSIEEMEQLRYLDLSNNNIKKIPSCITQLSHLQTLKLSQCYNLRELPKDLEDLSCLVHLDIEGCMDLTHMPRGISKLNSLETLSLFAASNKYPFGGLVELKKLNKLRGNLEIVHLEKLEVRGKIEDNQCLNEKEKLQQLALRWDHYDDDDDDDDEDEEEDKKKKGKEKGNNQDDKNKDKDKESLDFLQPHENLKVLIVEGYNGLKFSDWLSSIKNLVKFCLSDCPRCESLPALDQLGHLSVLELWRLDSLKFIAENLDTNQNASSFPKLKELTISDCPELESWWKDETYGNGKEKPFFNHISKLHIQCCPNLNCMPLYPYLDEKFILVDSSVIPMQYTMHAKTSKDSPSFSKLKSMIIERIDVSPPPTWLINFTSLEDLHIRDCSKLENLPQGFKSMSSLRRLTIEKCRNLDLDRSSEEWSGLKKLYSLILREIPRLKSLPKGIEHVTSLRVLELYQCSALSSLKEGISKLTSLKKLVISECRKLGSLPKGMEELKDLETLKIMDCPLLMTRCQPDTGDDWPQIKDVKNIVLRQTSKDMGKDFYY